MRIHSGQDNCHGFNLVHRPVCSLRKKASQSDEVRVSGQPISVVPVKSRRQARCCSKCQPSLAAQNTGTQSESLDQGAQLSNWMGDNFWEILNRDSYFQESQTCDLGTPRRGSDPRVGQVLAPAPHQVDIIRSLPLCDIRLKILY